ncbi:MAG: XrtA-associated ATPase [Chromatiales bacterium]|nr:XrtA-associated ATPase [Chromatiales bacterium]
MYESFYNLTDKPFQLSPDPRFFFQSQGHKRALAYLRYGLSQGEGFIIVTGGIGTGKTMLARTLFDELDDQSVVAGQLVTTQVGADDLLRSVAGTFGLAHDGVSKATLLKNLETFFRARAQEGKRVLLVVDEVQNLPERSLEELRMLSNFELGGRSLLQSFLLGQEEFRETLQSPTMEQLRQRVIAAYHLGPLNRHETREYIEHRLEMVDWKDDPHFTDEVYEDIHEFTNGVPRRINALCDRLLLYGYLEEKHVIDIDAAQMVYQEIRDETIRPEEEAKVEVPGGIAPAPPRPALAVSPEIDQRVQMLEEQVKELTRLFREERVLLRKAILLNLDLENSNLDLP